MNQLIQLGTMLEATKSSVLGENAQTNQESKSMPREQNEKQSAAVLMNHVVSTQSFSVSSRSSSASFGDDDADDHAVIRDVRNSADVEAQRDDKNQNGTGHGDSKKTGDKDQCDFDWSSVRPLERVFTKMIRWCFHILVGALAVSFWRGLWLLFDIYSCNQSAEAALLNGEVFCLAYDLDNPRRRNSGLLSCAIGLCLTCLGKFLYWKGCFQGDTTCLSSYSKIIPLALTRILIVQIMGMAGVLTWRGIWMLTEFWLFPNDVLRSNWLTAVLGCIGCTLLYCSASLIAAPAAILHDPSLATFDTILSAIQDRRMGLQEEASRQDQASTMTFLVDTLFSYVALPIVEVWCWRGVWTLQDYYFWGYTASTHDLHTSLGMGIVVFLCCVLTSRLLKVFVDTISFSRNNERSFAITQQVSTRLQNVLLGVSSISFWRVTWYIWEDFLGGSTLYSAWTSHLLGATGLIVLGCFASVTFPPSVDVCTLDDNKLQEGDDDGDEQQAAMSVRGSCCRWFGIATLDLSS